MPANYTGNPAAITPRQAVVVSNPVDGDARTAASNNAAIATLSDIMKYAMDKMGIIDQAQTWTLLQTLTSGFVANANSVVNGALDVNGALEANSFSTNTSVMNSVQCNVDMTVGGTIGGPGGAQLDINTAVVATAALTAASLTTNGHLSLTGSNPGVTTGFTNKGTPKNLVKCYGIVETGATPTILDGFNLGAIDYVGQSLRVTMASAMASTSYAVIPSAQSSAGNQSVVWGISSTTQFLLDLYTAGTQTDLSATARYIAFAVFGAQ